MLQDLASGRRDDDQVVRLAGRDEQPAIRAERDALRPHAGQLDLKARGRKDLIDGCVVTVRPDLADGLTG